MAKAVKKATLTEKLASLADLTIFPEVGPPLIRWGQAMRTTPAAALLLGEAMKAGRLVPLSNLATVKSGVVTRANAFFLVRELPFSQIPIRFHLTLRDHKRTAVIIDGKDSPHRIARKHLRAVIKGPEMLLGPTEIQSTDMRLVAVMESQEHLRTIKDNDTVAYLRRGETINYNLSSDKFKGGIPAQRSNIKNRKPFWYSLNLPASSQGCLVVPEHFDQKFIASELSGDDENRVVIDKCYMIQCKKHEHKRFVLMALNSLLTWYQIELRGRTNLGEGVLEVKIPDFSGILVLDPNRVEEEDATELMAAFSHLLERRTLPVVEELASEDRTAFDESYLRIVGLPKKKVSSTRFLIARELREAMAERRNRPDSVAEKKSISKPRQKVSRVIDSLAALVTSKLSPYPDPRHHVSPGACVAPLPVEAFEGTLTIGAGFFETGVVFAGGQQVAVTRSDNEARFVRAVLTIDPQLKSVDLPDAGVDLAIVMWAKDVTEWCNEFARIYGAVAQKLTDDKVAEAVWVRALELAHASEVTIARNSQR